MPQMVDQPEEQYDIEMSMSIRRQIINARSPIRTIVYLQQLTRLIVPSNARIVRPQGDPLSRTTTQTFESEEAIPWRDVQYSASVQSFGYLQMTHMGCDVLCAGHNEAGEKFP